MRRTRAVPVAALAVLVTGLAGCGGPGGGGAATSTTVSVRDQVAPVYRQLAQCIRDHGYPDFPDPVINPDGTAAELPDQVQRRLQQQEATIRPACEHLLRRLPAAVRERQGGDDPEQPATPAQLAERKRFVRCVRDHGVPDFPDPDPTGRIVLSGPDGKASIDPAALRALQQCSGKTGIELKRGLSDLGVR